MGETESSVKYYAVVWSFSGQKHSEKMLTSAVSLEKHYACTVSTPTALLHSKKQKKEKWVQITTLPLRNRAQKVVKVLQQEDAL